MKLDHPWLTACLGWAGSTYLRFLRRTIDWRALYADPTTDPIHPRSAGRNITVGWHETMIMGICIRSLPRMLTIASQSKDGEIITQTLERLGWSVIRGSSSRGGVGAMMRFLRDDSGYPNITVDGPRGPRRTMAEGAIFLASKVGLPLVAVGYAFEKPWRLNSWDKYAIPRPFTRGRAIYGPPRFVPPGLRGEDLERYRLWFERQINWLIGEAEQWADSGEKRPGEIRLLINKPSPGFAKWNPEHAVRLPEELEEEWRELSARPVRARVA